MEKKGGVGLAVRCQHPLHHRNPTARPLGNLQHPESLIGKQEGLRLCSKVAAAMVSMGPRA